MDEGRFRAFYDVTSRPLWAYLARSSGDRAIADDLMQDAYMRFLRAGLAGSATDEHCRNYLFRIASNLLTDHWRKTHRETGPPDDFAVEDASFDATDRKLDIGLALDILSPRQRQLLWLAYVEQMSHEEIAAMLGYKTESIAPLLSRARQKLADELKKGGSWTTSPNTCRR